MRKVAPISVWLAILLIAFLAASYKLRVPLALQDANLGLALEVLNEDPSALTRWRIKIFLLAGADPDKEITHWDMNVLPLVAAVQRGNPDQIRELSHASGDATWQSAVIVACENGGPSYVHQALANSRSADIGALCEGQDQLQDVIPRSK